MADVVVDQKEMPKLPYDPDVIPQSVKDRAAAVDALYSQNGSQSPPEGGPGSEPQQPSPEVPTPQVPASPVPPASAAQMDLPLGQQSDWENRYLAMKGRYDASQKTIGEMQEQMVQLGNELVQTQRYVARSGNGAPQSEGPQSYLTQEDVDNYGGDLVNFAQRAAVHAVAPKIQQIEQENAELRRHLARDARRILDQQVAFGVPDYQEIDRNPRWHRWLLGIDMLSGCVRQQLLDEAIASSDAPRVISFFRGFLSEERATGHIEPAPHLAGSPPREPAVPLASFAAPGRARPATGGDTSFPPDKPIYTRAQIAQLYSAHRKGAYVGREAEWARQDADIIRASAEGRIR